MSRRKPDQGECEERPSGLVRFTRRQSARGGERHKEVPISFHSFVLRAANFVTPKFAVQKFAVQKFAVLYALVFICWGAEMSRAQVSDAERTSYADALAYCRGDVPRPMALRSDKRVLCLDGKIVTVNEILPAGGLEQGGLFVVRSRGGDIALTIALADMLLTREATVIVNDSCVATCANYLFTASLKTFVPKDALVAWISHGPDNCIGFSEMRDPTAPYLREAPCAGSPSNDAHAKQLLELKDKFYAGRIFTPPFVEPPESVIVRRILKRNFDATGEYPVDIYWTWNPRYYASAIRTKVFYEAYPQSQDEVDAILARIGLQLSVIYDP